MEREQPGRSLPLIPAITAHSGRYTHVAEDGGEWEYAYDIHGAGTRSERRIGHLRADRLQHTIVTARPGDTLLTPWGLMERTPDSLYERGYLLERAHGQPIAPSRGRLLEVSPSMLERGGRWRGQIGPWRFTKIGTELGTSSERRLGRLYFGQTELRGQRQGDYVDTPWGRLRWMGPINPADPADREQGFLLLGTHDRSLDGLDGDPIFPESPAGAVRLESLYLSCGFRVSDEGPVAHAIALRVSGNLSQEVELSGTLALDPNPCTLNAFGDREACTRMAIQELEVHLVLQRLADPKGLRRRYFAVTGPALPRPMVLIVQRAPERCYLKLEQQLAPLYPDDEA